MSVRGLAAAVIVMGVLILAGIGLVVTTIAVRLSRTGAEPGGPVAAIMLGQPAGSRLVSVGTTAERIVLRVEGGGQPDRLLLLDAASGRPLAIITLGAP